MDPTPHKRRRLGLSDVENHTNEHLWGPTDLSQEDLQQSYVSCSLFQQDHQWSFGAPLDYAIQAREFDTYYGNYEVTGNIAFAAEQSWFEQDDVPMHIAPTLDQICYGMIAHVPLHRLQKNSLDFSIYTKALIRDGMEQLLPVRSGDGLELGELDEQWSTLFRHLSRKQGLELQFLVKSPESKAPNRRSDRSNEAEVFLFSILYGTASIAQSIGDILSQCGVYLQLPNNCDRNVPYQNPQSLSNEGAPLRMTDDLQSGSNTIEISNDWMDHSSILETQKKYPESEQPKGIISTLYSHQKEALFFMLARERGWDYHSDESDIYKAKQTDKGVQYIDMVRGTLTDQPPTDFRGGILADCMGLGKTLTVISLLSTTDIDPSSSPCQYHNGRSLLIVPLALLDHWIEEINRHTVKGLFRVWKYYRSGCSITSLEDFLAHDVVITTYDVVASQWRNQRKGQSNLFSVGWQRVILDEAHTIRQSSTVKARAVCALNSNIRWAVTGTPLHNGLQDLASLLHFLRIYPDMDALKLRGLLKKLTNESRALDLISPLCIRRPRKVIELPERKDVTRNVVLSSLDANLYQSAKAATIALLRCESLDTSSGGYTNILAKLNSLRQICNLGQYYNKPQETGIQGEMSTKQACEQTFEELQAADLNYCALCNDVIEAGSRLEYPAVAVGPSSCPQMTLCGCFLCGTCMSCGGASQMRCRCQGTGMCKLSPVIWGLAPVLTAERETIVELPVKIKALRDDILQTPPEDKSVVFSFWTTTLDLISIALHDVRIGVVRIDGSMPSSKRREALNQFRTSDDARALLLSLGCGSTGLNLTVANHVYLMEPQWNPMIEMQALDRVYRIGQTKKVTTVRYIAEDTIELAIRNQQEKKKRLAEKLFKTSHRSKEWVQRIRELVT